jgi:hypothetical protein
MAQAIAEHLPETRLSRSVTEFARLRLGDEHPLVAVLQHGVAYHHAALPVDVLEAIEDAVRDDQLGFIASTTSLTEGVNLPVRAVVLAETRYPGQPTDALLQGARLLNAMGRAGRACKECEGWVVLVESRRPNESDFELLAVDQEQLQVVSRLTDSDAIEAVSVLEDSLRANEDALFSLAADEVGEFVAFVWFLLAAGETLGQPPDDVDLDGALQATLAFVQLNQAQRDNWTRLAASVRSLYARTDQAQRRQWARTGTTIGSARALAGLAGRLAVAARDRPGVSDVDAALALIDEVGAVEQLLDLPEAPRQWVFRQTTSPLSAEISVDVTELLTRWVHGDSLARLANDFLAEVPAADFRIEQLVDAVTQHFEHFLAWTLGALLTLANEQLAARDEQLICPALPLFVRYGVDTLQALELLTRGVRSRELANAVGQEAAANQVDPEGMREWIRGMSIAVWRERFSASAPDVLDLLEYARARRGSTLRTLLEGGEASIPVERDEEQSVDDVVIEPAEGNPPVPLLVRDSTNATRARVPTGAHAELQAILDTGLDFRAALRGAELHVTLPGDEPGLPVGAQDVEET